MTSSVQQTGGPHVLLPDLSRRVIHQVLGRRHPGAADA